jgi:hypothetical protein
MATADQSGNGRALAWLTSEQMDSLGLIDSQEILVLGEWEEKGIVCLAVNLAEQVRLPILQSWHSQDVFPFVPMPTCILCILESFPPFSGHGLFVCLSVRRVKSYFLNFEGLSCSRL